MKLIVGLGNPGKQYENTRHNVGFIVLDNFAKGCQWLTEKKYIYTTITVNNEKVICIKPQNFMNLSGDAVSMVANFYKISPEDILIIQDDLDQASKKYKLKCNSSSGGHNGVKNIIEKLGTDKFARLKIGIGNDKNKDTKNYVLNKLSSEEIAFLQEEIFVNIINSFIIDGIDKTMNIYNRGK